MKPLKSMIMLFAMLLIFAFPTGTWAHSKLQSSVPAADAKVTESVQELSLSFNEKIDSTLSTLTIMDDKGEKINALEVKVEGSEIKAALEKPLVTGAYTVEWKIVGGDGHPVKGNYAFEVDAPQETNNTEQDTSDDSSVSEPDHPADNDTTNGDQVQPSETGTDTTDSTKTEDTPVDQTQSATDTDETNSGNIWWIALIVVVAVVGGYFALKQSRKRR